ncbi:uncharacterized protein LOC105182323 isoform X1 [Harpegnathos saltator]|uniref:uncharacterized protein LOC105182323 isoform X1 n=1 Tax=Harpegnathos saltator TaxID=610380 RepID=UPI000948C04F|nr:uncharacterized protein LOC105182323 isoform X1 [Harpegnathos saltator]
MTKSNEEMDISSSEDEISTHILKEAVDQQFLNENLYNTQSRELKINKSNKKSLRTNLKEKNQFINFGVTTTFQNFVAKKLDEMLERIIDTKQYKTTDYCMKSQRKRSEKSGIKLLSSSKKFLSTTETYPVHEKKSKKRKNCYELVEDDDAISKFREAAVDPGHILNKLDTKAWTNKRPEPEFKYKRLKNGTLIEQS